MSDLVLQDVAKAFGGTPVLRDITLAVAAGTFVVVVGPSGCGKTTLLRSLAGLETPDGGIIRLAGRNVTHLPPAERDVAMVFQNYGLYPTKTVFENMAFGLRRRGLPRREIEARVAGAAERVQIAGLLQRRPSQLSGGQRQRGAMGRAIVREPRLFLFDEPLSNLDAALRTDLRLEIKRLQRAAGVTAVYVTHDQQEAMTLSDLLVVMRDGRIEQMGPPKAVFDRPRSRFVAGFLGAPPMGFLPARLQRGVFRFGDGLTWAPDRPIEGLPVEDDVELGVRPEEIRLVAPSVTGALPARVDLVEELGRFRLVHLTGPLGPLTASLPADGAVPAGPVGVLLPGQEIAVFRWVGGERLDRAA